MQEARGNASKEKARGREGQRETQRERERERENERETEKNGEREKERENASFVSPSGTFAVELARFTSATCIFRIKLGLHTQKKAKNP